MKRRCANCVYLLHPVRPHPSRDLTEPQLILPLCLNHAASPGEVREVHPCECCRNFQAQQEPCRGIEPPPGPEVKYIPLGNRQYAIVDAADFDWLNRHTWHVMGGQSVLGYAYRYEHGKKIFMHREIMQTPPGMVAHHKNHNRVNNRRGNLRNCKSQENQRSRYRRTRNQSGYVGVYPHGLKWLALVFSGGKVVYREVFEDKVEAAKARDRKAYELFGPFAYLNFPEEIRGGPPTGPGGPEPRMVDLSGSAHAHCRARATLTVIPSDDIA